MRTFDYLRHLVSRSSADAERLTRVRCSHCNKVVPVAELAIANACDDFYICRQCKQPLAKYVSAIEAEVNHRVKTLGFMAYYLFAIAEPLSDEERLRLLNSYVSEVKAMMDTNHKFGANIIMSTWIITMLDTLVRANMARLPQYAYMFSKMLKAYEHGVSALRREPVRTASQGRIRGPFHQSRHAETL